MLRIERRNVEGPGSEEMAFDEISHDWLLVIPSNKF